MFLYRDIRLKCIDVLHMAVAVIVSVNKTKCLWLEIATSSKFYLLKIIMQRSLLLIQLVRCFDFGSVGRTFAVSNCP